MFDTGFDIASPSVTVVIIHGAIERSRKLHTSGVLMEGAIICGNDRLLDLFFK